MCVWGWGGYLGRRVGCLKEVRDWATYARWGNFDSKRDTSFIRLFISFLIRQSSEVRELK